MLVDWSRYPNFNASEFDCSVTGKNDMRPEFLELLQRIRTEYGRVMNINSGYRDKTHPLEIRKARGGTHTLGLACDVAVEGENTLDLLSICLNRGIRRIGIKQKAGESRYIHIDLGHKYGFPKAIWSY